MDVHELRRVLFRRSLGRSSRTDGPLRRLRLKGDVSQPLESPRAIAQGIGI